MDYSTYSNKYITIIKDYSQNKTHYADHKIYEMLWAIDQNMILWDDIPPNFSDIHDIPNNKDYGIDLINLDHTKTCQVKLYNKNSSITFKHMSTFYTMSNGMLDINNMILATTTEASLVKHAQTLIKKKNID